MDIFEYSEVRCPARTLQQDEEEAATSTASWNVDPPIVLWNEQLRRRLYPNGIMCKLAVIATTKASCALLTNAIAGKAQVLGTVVLPDVSMRGNNLDPGSTGNASCLVQALGEQGEVLAVCCQYAVAPERAAALARGMLAEVCPHSVLVLGSLPAEQYRGEGDPSQESLLFLLSTTAARAAVAAAAGTGAAAPAAATRSLLASLPAPYLPSGSVVGGLPAAILSYCQVRAMQADLLVSVDMVPSLAVHALRPLAAASRRLLQRQQQQSQDAQAAAAAPASDAVGVLADQLGREEVLAAAGKAAAAAAGGSASGSCGYGYSSGAALQAVFA